MESLGPAEARDDPRQRQRFGRHGRLLILDTFNPKASLFVLLCSLRGVILAGVAYRSYTHYHELLQGPFGLPTIVLIKILWSFNSIYVVLLVGWLLRQRRTVQLRGPGNPWPSGRLEVPRRFAWLQIVCDSLFYAGFYATTLHAESDFFVFFLVPILVGIAFLEFQDSSIVFIIAMVSMFISLMLIGLRSPYFRAEEVSELRPSRILGSIWAPRAFAFLVASVPVAWLVQQAKYLKREWDAQKEELSDTRRLMLRMLDHQLSRPLVDIERLVRLIREGESHPGDLDTIEVECQRAIRVIETARHYAERSLYGELPAQARRLPLSTMLSKLRARYSLHASRKRIDLEVEQDPNLHARGIRVNDYVEIALENLVSNALDYNTFPGRTEPGRIRIAVQLTDSEVRIHVDDNGPGLEAARLRQLIAGETVKYSLLAEASSGMGIGLGIAASLVKACDGCLEGQSSPGAGARFVIRLPLAPDGVTP